MSAGGGRASATAPSKRKASEQACADDGIEKPMTKFRSGVYTFQISMLGSGILGEITLAGSVGVDTLRNEIERITGVVIAEQRIVIGHDLLGADCSSTVEDILRLLSVKESIASKENDPDQTYVLPVTVIRDRRRLALTGTSKGQLFLWDLDSCDAPLEMKGHNDWIQCMSVNWELRKAVSGSRDKSVRFWDVESGMLLQQAGGHTGPVTHVAVDWKSHCVLSGSRDRTLRWSDLSKGHIIYVLSGHAGIPTCLALELDGASCQRALSASRDRTLRLWNLRSGKLIHVFKGHSMPVTSLSVDWRHQRALSGCRSTDNLRIWHLVYGTQLHELKLDGVILTSLSVDWFSSRMLCGGSPGYLQLWDLRTGNLVLDPCIDSRNLTCMTVDWTSHRALIGADQFLRALHFDATSSIELLNLGVIGIAADWLAERAVSGSEDGTLRLWDLVEERLLAVLPDLPDIPKCLALDCGRHLVLSCGMGNNLHVWKFSSLGSGENILRSLLCPIGWISCMASNCI